MARYRGPRYKQCRRAGTDYVISRTRPYAAKCRSEKTPGVHGGKPGRSVSDYASQLRMKQMLKQIYGVLEKQFRSYYQFAKRMHGATGENIIKILESRLDNLVYRSGFAASRREARQLVRHGAITVNDQKVDIPSYRVQPNDVIEVNEKAKKQLRIQAALETAQQVALPSWLEIDVKKMTSMLKAFPSLEDLPPEYRNVNLVVEFYSK
jgi:small subunit ribosomal protein S4